MGMSVDKLLNIPTCRCTVHMHRETWRSGTNYICKSVSVTSAGANTTRVGPAAFLQRHATCVVFQTVPNSDTHMKAETFFFFPHADNPPCLPICPAAIMKVPAVAWGQLCEMWVESFLFVSLKVQEIHRRLHTPYISALRRQ